MHRFCLFLQPCLLRWDFSTISLSCYWGFVAFSPLFSLYFILQHSQNEYFSYCGSQDVSDQRPGSLSPSLQIAVNSRPCIYSCRMCRNRVIPQHFLYKVVSLNLKRCKTLWLAGTNTEQPDCTAQWLTGKFR